MSDSTSLSGCRICGGADLKPVLNLGDTPLANRLLSADQLQEAEPRFPLRVVFCPACSLVQLTETVAPEVLFRDYSYLSSFSDALVRHAKDHVDALRRERPLGPKSLVVEVASNDGYLLQHFVAAGIPVLGIEPATNIAKVANDKGVRTVNEFFGLELAASLRKQGTAADVLLGSNVLAHVADLNGFVKGAAELLSEDGVVEFEFPYVVDLIDHVEFDTIYHEHLCYFSGYAIERLFERNGLVFTDVTHLSIHGGSLRVRGAKRKDAAGRARVEALLAAEKKRGVDGFAYYAEFGARVEKLKSALNATLKELKAQGKRLAAYGASAKGATLMAYCGLGKETLDFLVDRSTVKQGKFAPGTHLPIRPVEALLEAKPDAVLLLTWNFSEEILAQQAEYRRAGGKFVVPVPHVHVV